MSIASQTSPLVNLMKDFTSGIELGEFTKVPFNAAVLGMTYAGGAGGVSKISQASGAKAAMMFGASMNTVGG